MPLTLAAARPRIEIVGRNVAATTEAALGLQADEMTLADTLTFSVRTPAAFGREQVLEVATADGSVATTLSQANGALRLENARVAVARFAPAKVFDGNVFGLLQVRSVSQGVAGDWQPLIHLVRLPSLRELRCPPAGESPESTQGCVLSGQELYLIEAVAAAAGAEQAVVVPEGFTGSSLVVPRPVEGDRLYLRLRDRPEVVRVLRSEKLPAVATTP